MKKLLIYSWLPCLVAMFMCATFTACDDDDDVNYSTAILGTWYMGEEGNCIFNEDGTGKEIDNDGWSRPFTYTLNGNELNIWFEKDSEGIVVKIQISGNKAKITESYYYYYEDGELEYDYEDAGMTHYVTKITE